MQRTPYGGIDNKKLYAVREGADAIDWAYQVTFGERDDTHACSDRVCS